MRNGIHDKIWAGVVGFIFFCLSITINNIITKCHHHHHHHHHQQIQPGLPPSTRRGLSNSARGTMYFSPWAAMYHCTGHTANRCGDGDAPCRMMMIFTNWHWTGDSDGDRMLKHIWGEVRDGVRGTMYNGLWSAVQQRSWAADLQHSQWTGWWWWWW